ncbi:HAD family hydrolase [Motiliproteus coralliicola]|uniref:HAD family hydrolase n=1 Tax=Motiliproteus coralliicola TaxID=2283196 RepID=A0A369WRN2_9GAMM|nr:HAD family hydrolase [Motiliproteus coralliicola]RDE24760.1 HAD family hydrolase [Motiliproteus coralliicola]
MTPDQLLQKRYWIFDLDGTLTLPLHDFTAMRAELGIPNGAGILEHIEQQPEPLRSELNTILDRIELDVARRSEPMPLACELVRRLIERGCELAILTRNRRDCVDIVLQRLGLLGCFEPAAIIASGCATPKPSPDGIHRLLDGWQCRPSEAVMVGDFLYDLEAGRAAGVATVHFAVDRQQRWPELTDLLLEGFEPLLSRLRD